jgi:hypothetical protein
MVSSTAAPNSAATSEAAGASVSVNPAVIIGASIGAFALIIVVVLAVRWRRSSRIQAEKGPTKHPASAMELSPLHNAATMPRNSGDISFIEPTITPFLANILNLIPHPLPF